MNADLALREVTLRGIGSYLHGARLEVRPLTILCGPNGSGKSTWLRALYLLRLWCREERFPFNPPVRDFDEYDISLTNAYVHLMFDEKAKHGQTISHIGSEVLDREYGPPCTIGFLLEATHDFKLEGEFKHEDADPALELHEFFWNGKCARGTKVQVRIAHPTTSDEEIIVAGFGHFIELCVNDEFVFRFSTANNRNFQYLIQCSGGFLPEFSGKPPQEEVQLGTYSPYEKDDQVVAFEGMLDDAGAALFVKCAISRIRELTRRFFDGFFLISAIRTPHRYANLSLSDHRDNSDVWKGFENDEWDDFDEWAGVTESEQVSKTRYVGRKGEATWFLERDFACNAMSPVGSEGVLSPIGNTPFFEGFVSKWSERLLNIKFGPSMDRDEASVGWPESPVGFLIDDQPDRNTTHELDLYGILEHACFGEQQQGPRQMSAGFHQLMPIIVQAALMRRYEVLAIENPEVHLHPSLQLEVARFLMHQAKSGKWVVVETHSDLFIRRIIREILDEEIGLGQASVAINFSRIDTVTSEEGFRYSVLEPIRIDDQGKIINWPAGFLDDDVRESRRLLDVMYGPPPDEDEDSEG